MLNAEGYLDPSEKLVDVVKVVGAFCILLEKIFLLSLSTAM